MKMSTTTTSKLLQSCPTLCDPTDGSPPGSPVPGILQARTLERVAISFSNAWKWSRSVVSDPQRPHGLQPTRFHHPWDFPGKSTGVGCHCLLQKMSTQTTQNLCDSVEGVLRGRFIAIQAYLKKQERNQINNLTLYLKQLEKEKMKHPRVSRRKEIIKIRT